MSGNTAQQTADSQTGFSRRTQDRLLAIQNFSDCRIRACDGTSFALSKSQLVVQSGVFRKGVRPENFTA